MPVFYHRLTEARETLRRLTLGQCALADEVTLLLLQKSAEAAAARRSEAAKIEREVMGRKLIKGRDTLEHLR